MVTLTESQNELVQFLLEKIFADDFFEGEELLEQGNVVLTANSLNDFFFKVKSGNKKNFDVRINLGIKDKRIKKVEQFLFCSCRDHSNHGQCGHSAAALHLLSTLAVNDPELTLWPKETTNKSSSQAKATRKIPKEFTIPFADFALLPEILPDLEVKIGNIPIQRLQFLPKGLSYFVYLGRYIYEILVIYDLKESLLKINFSKEANGITPEIFQFLRIRFSDAYRDQYFLSEELRSLTKKKFLEEQGLLSSVKIPEEAVKIIFSGNRITLSFSGELSGLREANEVAQSLSKLLPSRTAGEYMEYLKNSDHAKEIGKYNLGFILNYGAGNTNKVVITPIIGKGKKHDPEGLHTRLEVLKDSKDYRLMKKEGLSDLTYDLTAFNKAMESNDEETAWKMGLSFFRKAKDFPIYVDDSSYFNSNNLSYKVVEHRVYPKEASAKFKLLEYEAFLELKLLFCFDGEEYYFEPIPGQGKFKYGIGHFDSKILFFNDFSQAEGISTILKLLPVKFPKKQLAEVFNEIIVPLSGFLPFEDHKNLIDWISKGEVFREELYITELGGLVAFVPKVVYGEDISIDLLNPSLVMDSDTKKFVDRNKEAEQEFLEFLRDLHPAFELEVAKYLFKLPAAEFAKGTWFLETFEKLKARGVKTFGLENISIKRYSPFSAKVSTQFTSSQDWFGVSSDISFGKEVIPLSKAKKLWESGEKFVQLGDGSLGKIPESWMKKMLSLLRAGESDGEEVRISKIHFMLLEDWEDSPEFSKIQKELERKKKKMSQFTGIHEVAVPKKIKADLRPYQKTGLNWLNFLREFQWGGILADDMGLGKTLQMITLICQMEEQNSGIKALIVAPTTLLFNWKKELEKFAPHLDFWVHHGQRYETIEELSKHQLVLTSYGLIINDLEILQKIEWDLIVADESQAIKNTSSLRYKAMLRLKGKQRIALTGTPIENGIHELYAQMNFTNPGFFKTFNHFSGNYLTPIKQGQSDIIESLKKQITPFVLRRTKKEVLTELPDKIEEFLYCEMGAAQRAIYEAKREEYKNYLLKKFSEEGADQSKMFVLEGLTRLRQICDSPKLTGDSKTLSSAKIELLKEHILEKTGNHKLLVFSQFVKMLELIREQLDENGISYCYLDGQTSLPEREKQVQKFQENDSVRVFLISLKAGGTGLNLTAADYVYIVDPWWNPAVENQAIDRCYRMGQEKHVMAYRMICQNTIEEKIMDLQLAKSKLAKDIIGEGEGILAGLDREGMLELFS